MLHSFFGFIPMLIGLDNADFHIEKNKYLDCINLIAKNLL